MELIILNSFNLVAQCQQSVGNLTVVRFFAAARAITKQDQIQVDALTLGQALIEAETQFPGLTKALPKCSYLINGLATKDLTSLVKPGDTIDVLPPFAGG